MKTIFQWFILSGAVYVLAQFTPDIGVSPWWVALIVGAVLTFIDIIVRPIIKILTLPITLITFGLFSIVLNALFFWFPSQIIGGFSVLNIKAAILGGVVMSLVNWIWDKVKGSE